MSRIGKKSIVIPSDVKVEIKDGNISVEGPKGKLNRSLHYRIKAEVEGNRILVKRISDIKMDKSLHGLYRTLIFNMIKGVREGYVKELEIIGVGFKAQTQGNKMTMHLGFSHPVIFTIPEGINIENPKQTQIIIRGIDKEKVNQLASQIRAAYPPEPYKGKGVRYSGEYVKKKAGKSQASTK